MGMNRDEYMELLRERVEEILLVDRGDEPTGDDEPAAAVAAHIPIDGVDVYVEISVPADKAGTTISTRAFGADGEPVAAMLVDLDDAVHVSY